MTLPSTIQTPLCSEESLIAGEPLYGSAPVATTWILLEYDNPWGEKAWAESEIPTAVKTHLDEVTTSMPGTRLQLIRQRPRMSPGGLHFYIAHLDGKSPRLVHFTLDAYEDLLQIDLKSLIQDQGNLSTDRETGPVFLVCTNGRRDACCARYGTPTYSALREEFGEAVWQTSHIGGHRFAANLVCLPEGICYGRVRPDTAVGLASVHCQGQIDLEYYRGCSLYPPVVQAAEALLRVNLGLTGLPDLAFETVEGVGDHAQLVIFRGIAGERYTIMIEVIPRAYSTRMSCRDSQPGYSDAYQLVEFSK